MNEIITWIAVAVILLLLFVALLLLGIIRKNVKLVIASVACFVLFMGAGAVAAWRVVRGTISLAAETAKRRTGIELYTDVLGNPAGCVQVYSVHDPLIPTDPDPPRACFSTCPQEVRRVLAARDYEIVKRAAGDIAPMANSCCSNYFSRERFGDTLMECIASDAGHTYTVYLSADSTHGFFTAK